MEYIKKIERKVITLVLYLLRIFPIKNNKILFCNFMGKGYGDNSKYIYQELASRDIKLDVVWAVENDVNRDVFPEEIRVVKLRSLRYFYDLVTSKVWVDNSRKPSYVRKRKNQYYIQTWHGSIALKKIEKDAENALGNEYLKCAKNDAKMTDLMLSNSQFCTDMYRRAFWYEGEILVSGSPRNDILVKRYNQKSEELRKKIGIKENTKIALYAPTFRVDGSLKVYDIDFEKFHKVLTKKFGGEWIIILKLHPLIADKVISTTYSYVKNYSKYNDIYELMSISEMLITDYSSIMFEMLLTEKPVFLYASDVEEYMDDRGFYFDYNELPFPKAKNTSELQHIVEEFDDINYKHDVANFMTRLNIVENGDASEKVCNHILKVMQGIAS